MFHLICKYECAKISIEKYATESPVNVYKLRSVKPEDKIDMTDFMLKAEKSDDLSLSFVADVNA